MSEKLNRRGLLRTSVGALALAGVGIAELSVPAAAQERRPQLPPIPGMLGDRLANEMWYVLDDVTLFHRLPEVTAAFRAIGAALGGDLAMENIVKNWTEMSTKPEYPGNYTAYMTPVREPLQTLSRIQLGVFDRHYRPYSPRLITAFADFGQGLLYDPRRAEYQSEVHMMNGSPTPGYHLWHAILRAQMFLGIDRRRWAALDPLIGLAWAMQSVAKPHPRQPNPPLPRATVLELAASWLPRSPSQLDTAFQAFPYPDSPPGWEGRTIASSR
ncbi:hypothetical protein [Streptomyces jumonjinensis]|uniref:hypothetical protein n=1 Tax=Streptomyces jumonjinensis TaxID=1945 RepID=UPI0037BA9427